MKCICGNFEPRITKLSYYAQEVIVCKNCGRTEPRKNISKRMLPRYHDEGIDDYSTNMNSGEVVRSERK